MKHILIVGGKSCGKSTTIEAIVDKLKPVVTYKIDLETETKEDITSSTDKHIRHNGTYVIEVSGKFILICSGSPSEQKCPFIKIWDIVQKLFGKIVFAIIAVRNPEAKGYSTEEDLKPISTCVCREELIRIEPTRRMYGRTLCKHSDFIARVDRLYKMVII